MDAFRVFGSVHPFFLKDMLRMFANVVEVELQTFSIFKFFRPIRKQTRSQMSTMHQHNISFSVGDQGIPLVYKK